MSERVQRERQFHDQRFALPSSRAKRVGRFYGITHTIWEQYHRYMETYSAGTRVLELGCGPGADTSRLARSGTRVIAVDISRVALNAASERADQEGVQSGMAFAQMNAETLGFRDNSFDVVCGAGVLHHMQIAEAMNGLARVLRPSGQAVLIEPLGHNTLINLFRRLTPKIRSEDEHPLLTKDLHLLLRYFGRVDVQYHYLVALLAAPLARVPGFKFVLHALESIDGLLFRLPFLRRQAWQVLIKLSDPMERWASECTDE